jgi:hypothetical protein
MQKVVGSSPIIRLEKAPETGLSCCLDRIGFGFVPSLSRVGGRGPGRWSARREKSRAPALDERTPGARGSVDAVRAASALDVPRAVGEHAFVTSQGSAHGRFQRAIERGLVDQAEIAARELGRMSLVDALSLVGCYARAGSPKSETAAVRWLARLAVEGRDIRLPELQLAAAALVCLRGRRGEQAQKTLLRLL